MRQKTHAKIITRIVLLALFGLAALFPTHCQKKFRNRAFKVGILCGLDNIHPLAEEFKVRMNELGYLEGRDIAYDFQHTNFEPEKEMRILKRFVEDKSDLILTFPTEVSMAAKEATRGTGIPIVFAAANIEGMHLVESIIRPGGNLTGVRFPGPDIAVKRFEFMHELVPKARRMWIPYQRGYPIVPIQLEMLRSAAKAAGVSLIEFPADNAAEIRAELDAREKSKRIGFDAILLIPEPISCTDDAFAVMGRFAYRHRMPIGGHLMQVGAFGSIFGINVNAEETGRQAAELADKILNGAPAGGIPVVSSESYLEINYKAARALGVKVPEGLLSRADRIIH
jgi:putative tryptophan/tyrosine transport system substrate-binding protein